VRKAALSAVAICSVLAPTGAIAQETSPAPGPETQLAAPLIEGTDLLFLLIVVSGLALLLLGWMVWISRDLGDEGNGETYVAMIQGMVLVTVVVAVILLGVSGKITEEGLATILAAIVGFAVGKTSESARGRREGVPARRRRRRRRRRPAAAADQA
jgi:hypothetical protein